MDKAQLVQVLLPVIILQFVLMITALVSIWKQPATRGPKWIWVLIVLFVNVIGPILYFILGRGREYK
ncbi:PLD nuclease N-terminal domain-containing protein [Bacillus sp. 1P06AnD]|uniref:PLD nuclease N-terminal domain-containing protein n=1 Tax=Bacillus sp. 1P06AnD TaxID=3132208 RepID=UPI0039A145A2